jgi:hypothetical protein
MYLQQISEGENVFYLSTDGSGLGKVLIESDLNSILVFVQTDLFNDNTEFQPDAVFEDLGEGALVAELDKWYALRLNNNLYQIILTDSEAVTSLPARQKWTGSLNDLIGYLYSILI